MANTTTKGGRTISIVPDGSTDWNCLLAASSGLARNAPNGLPIKSIEFKGSAASDQLIVREGSATGPEIMNVTVTAATDERIKYFNQGREKEMRKPFISNAEQTFGTPANVRIIIEI